MKELYIRHYIFDGPVNFRDLGGYLTKDNKITKFNCLYRADKLDFLSENDIKKFDAMEIRTIIDLRSDREIEKHPDVIPEFVDYIKIPLMEHNLKGEKDAFFKSLQVRYEEIIKYDQHNIKTLFETIDTQLEKGGIVFHCSAGKDRTGVLAALLLMLFNVINEDIVADYEVSYTYNEEYNKIRFKDKSEKQMKAMAHLLGSKRENMLNLLKIVNRENIQEYLLSCGIKKDTLENIKNKCLKPLIIN